MSVQKLSTGRWRATVRDPATGRRLSVAAVLGPPASFAKEHQARAAWAKAREILHDQAGRGITVSQWAQTWTTDPLYRRPKDSTNILNAERIGRFVDAHADLPLNAVDDLTVARWIAGARNVSTIPSLRAMFNDAASAKAGRLIDRNPFARLNLPRSAGRRHQQPPSAEQVTAIIGAARDVSCPSFAAWLQVACYSGLRPGELDGLLWDMIDLDRGRIRVAQQFNAKTRTFTLPKNGQIRSAPLTPPAREALLALPRESTYCFVNLRGDHWTPSGRAYHWKAVKAKAGWEHSLYLATRHFAGWYMRNTLRLDSEDVAIALGHTDGGELVRRLYGHLEVEDALDRVTAAYERAAKVIPIRRKDTA